MQLIVNGEPCQTQAVFVLDLILERGLVPERVAVVHNDAIVPATARAQTRLVEGDRVELLAFAAGG
jgi:sulfur carrier protein